MITIKRFLIAATLAVTVLNTAHSEDQHLTPNLKVKRKMIDDLYSAFYEKWFTENEIIVWPETLYSLEPGRI